jgi:glycerol-3-phosphate acyltransferase PlsX
MIPTKAASRRCCSMSAPTPSAKPHHLAQFAIMGDAYSRSVLGTVKPSVGLMSIGEEEAKGNDLTKEAFPLLRAVEQHQLRRQRRRTRRFSGMVDVIVTDGFTGNVMLKLSEGLTEAMLSMLKRELTATAVTKAGAMLAKPAFEVSRNVSTIRSMAARRCWV